MTTPAWESTDIYGRRARLGLIVPPTNTTNEAEWARMVPPGVTFHVHRMAMHGDTTSEAGKQTLRDDLNAAFDMVGKIEADAIAYACTAGSMMTPAHHLPEALSAEHGIPAVTTAAAIIDALRILGVKRVSVATPYVENINDHEKHFLTDHGFVVDRLIGLGLGRGGGAKYLEIARTPLEKIHDHARAAFVEGSDALLITCTDFPTLPLITGLEAELGVPVVTSNQATLWAILRAASIDDKLENCGRLLAQY